jgi:folate-binding protein YgfZ
MKLPTATHESIKKCREQGFIAVLRGKLKEEDWGDPDRICAIRVSGSDSVTFLHSQLTNEVKALKPGEGNLSARVTRTGTLVSYFSLHRTLEETLSFVLVIEGRHAVQEMATLLDDLRKFSVVEDVELDDVSCDYDWVTIQGPNAASACEQAFGKLKGAGDETTGWADVSEYAIRDFQTGPAGGSFVITRSLTGDPGFIVALPREAEMVQEFIARFKATELGKTFDELDNVFNLNETLDTLRIEAGVVRMGFASDATLKNVDAISGKVVLPETGLEQYVVSYSKGCYLGQEVIARIRTYGSVPFVLRGLIFTLEKIDLNAPPVIGEIVVGPVYRIPEPGAEVVLEDGTKIGRMASRTFSPVFDTPIAFAYLDRAHRTPGTKLRIRASDINKFYDHFAALNGTPPGTKLIFRANNVCYLDAEVRLLPFYRAADTASRVAFLHDRAIRLFAAGDDAKAQELLEEALRLDPSFADGYEALGVILGRTGKFTEAIDIFKRLEEVAPNEPMVHTNLSLFYMKLGDKVAAEDEKAKGIIKQFGRFAGAKKAEQVAAEEADKKKADAERKRAMFEEVLEIDADDAMALFGLGNALSTLGDWEGAERVLSKSCTVQADNSAAFLARGKALEMLHREADAVGVYRAGMAVASKKGDLMPLKEMERRVLLLGS